jgi:pimeloyl-ACP methyl ester carboxylesterase
MARQILFVQGGGEGTYDEWDNKLVDSLGRELGPGYDIIYPRMPNEGDPDPARWTAALQSELTKFDAGAIVVGHSFGGTILIHALATDPPACALDGIFLLAAPFAGDGGWPIGDIKPRAEQLGTGLPNGVPVYLYQGDDDDIVPVAHLDLYAKAIPKAVIRRLSGQNHQLNDDLSEVARDVRSLSDAKKESPSLASRRRGLTRSIS